MPNPPLRGTGRANFSASGSIRPKPPQEPARREHSPPHLRETHRPFRGPKPEGAHVLANAPWRAPPSRYRPIFSRRPNTPKSAGFPRRVMSPCGSTPISPITDDLSLFRRSHTRTGIGSPCGSLPKDKRPWTDSGLPRCVTMTRTGKSPALDRKPSVPVL